MSAVRYLSTFLVLSVVVLGGAAAPAAAESRGAAGYIGSQACEGCHTYQYQRWKETRHGYTIRSGESARQAGYPFPKTHPGGSKTTIKSWKDVLYVFGGKQRVAYVDRDGKVDSNAYHSRLSTWRSFPTDHVVTCAGCHTTGIGDAASLAPEKFDPQNPPWSEAAIGCEACHGPGALHAKSLEKADIVINPSSRVCGGCHTKVGAILPRDDRHDTHDFVQSWHHDPHMLGTRWQSHNAFCSQCHAPFQAVRGDRAAASERRVFSEARNEVSCQSCHDPHNMTSPAMSPATFTKQPPPVTRAHLLLGHDGDITTSDYATLGGTQQSCLACHRGADKVVLDHAGATCNDCHVSYWRNRGVESRIFHDANKPQLGCSGCHANADHLLSLVYLEPEFLRPSYIHDLKSLPADVVQKYNFKYPGLHLTRPIRTRKAYDDDIPVPKPEPKPKTEAKSARISTPVNSRDAVPPWLRQPPHEALRKVPRFDPLVRDLEARPGSLARSLRLAHAYQLAGHEKAARDVLVRALASDPSWSVLELDLDGAVAGSATTAPRDPEESRAIEEILQLLDGEPRRQLAGWLSLWRGDPATALESLKGPEKPSARLLFYRGLAELMLGRFKVARTRFEAAAESAPALAAPRVGLGLRAVLLGEENEALHQLKQAGEISPNNAVSTYLLGRTSLRAGRPKVAIGYLVRTRTLASGFLDAGLALGRAYRLSESPDQAIELYRSLVIDHPGDSEPRFRVAQMLKQHSDQLRFQLMHDQEAARAGGVSVSEQTTSLTRRRETIRSFEDEALAEYRHVLARQKGHREALRQVAEIFRRRGRLADAEDILSWLEERHPGSWLLSYRRGLIALRAKRLDGAIASFERSAGIAPNRADPQAALGLAYLVAGRVKDAAGRLIQATVLEPFNPSVYTNLGVAHARLGRLHAAQEAFERALELGTFPLPRRHLVETNLAIIHARRGDGARARLSLKRALHLYPGYDVARTRLTMLDGRAGLQALARTRLLANDWLEIFGEVTTVSFDDR